MGDGVNLTKVTQLKAKNRDLRRENKELRQRLDEYQNQRRILIARRLFAIAAKLSNRLASVQENV